MITIFLIPPVALLLRICGPVVGRKKFVPLNEAVFQVVVELFVRHLLVAREGRLVEGIRGTSCVGVVGNVVGTERHHGLEEGQKLPGETVYTITVEKLG